LNPRWILCSGVLLPLVFRRCDFRCRLDFVAQLVSRASCAVVILFIVFCSDLGAGLVRSICDCEP
jgi:hypothetical protein